MDAICSVFFSVCLPKKHTLPVGMCVTCVLPCVACVFNVCWVCFAVMCVMCASTHKVPRFLMSAALKDTPTSAHIRSNASIAGTRRSTRVRIRLSYSTLIRTPAPQAPEDTHRGAHHPILSTLTLPPASSGPKDPRHRASALSHSSTPSSLHSRVGPVAAASRESKILVWKVGASRFSVKGWWRMDKVKKRGVG